MPRSSRRSRKRKASGSRHSPEVFVLSPQLLQKLGINIENIQPPIPGSSSVIASDQDEVFKKPRSTRRSNKTTEESSVMTTATLMKESVLLSPSFINPVESQESTENIPDSSPIVNSPGNVPVMPTFECDDDIPLSSILSQRKDLTHINPDIHTLAEPTVITKADPIKLLKENDVCDNMFNEQPSITPKKNDTCIILEKSCSDLQYHIQTYIKEENEIFNLQKDLPVGIKKKIIVPNEDKSLITLNDLNIDDDHLDEAYSSDCSNGHNTISHVSAEFNLEPPNVGSIRGHKINILSEEVIDNSRLNEMISKSLSPNLKDKMIPVSVDTIMSFNRNVAKADNSPKPIKCKSDFNCQDLSQSANVSMEQVSTADESFLDNIITGVMKMDEIDINILEVSDADLNSQNLSNSINMNISEDSESNKLDITSEVLSRAEVHYDTKLNTDFPRTDLHSDHNVQIANIQDLSKVMFDKNPQESNPNIFIEFIDKYPEVKESILSKINENEYDSAMMSQIEAYMNMSHDNLLSEPNPLSEINPPIKDIINIDKKTEMNTIEIPNIISTDSSISEEKIEVKHIKQENMIGIATSSGALCKNHVNAEILEPQTEPVLEMNTDPICNCKCNINKAKIPHQAKNDVSNGKNEKLNEIARYLKMFVENKRNRSSKINSTSRPANISSQAVLKPKSCVHGVEKPGGSNEDRTRHEDDLTLTREANHEPRTYKRNKNMFKPTKPCTTNSDTIIAHEKDINISDNMMANEATDNFCLCGDYGTFQFYDFEVKTYNHIHYWDNISKDFDIVEWFSEVDYIDYAKKNFNESKYSQNITETYEKVLEPICWIGWDHPNKTIDKDLLFGKVKRAAHMPNVLIINDLPKYTIEATERNNPKIISLENAETKMVFEDNESASTSINKMASEVKEADNPAIDCEVIYQVIECSDKLKTIQKRVNEDPDSLLGATLARSLTHSKKTDKEIDFVNVKQSKVSKKTVNEESYDCDSNIDGKILTEKVYEVPESKLQDAKTIESKTRGGPKSNRNSTRKSERKVSSNVESFVNLTEAKSSIAFGDNMSSDLNMDDLNSSVTTDGEANKPKPELKAREVKITRKSSGNENTKAGESEIKANEIKSTRKTKRKSSKDIDEESKAKGCNNISNSEGQESINTCPKIPNFDLSNALSTEEDSKMSTKPEKKGSIRVKQVSQINSIIAFEESNDAELEFQSSRKSSRKRSSNIEPDLTNKGRDLTIRSKRHESVDIKTESNSIISTYNVPDIKSSGSATGRQSRNTRKETEAITDKITNVVAVDDQKTSESTTKRQSRKAKSEIEVKTDEITKTEDALIPNESIARRRSRNARNDIEPEKVPKTVELKTELSTRRQSKARKDIDPETNKTTKSDAVMDIKTNKSITTRQSRNATSESEAETDEITKSDTVNTLITNESTTRGNSRNARKNAKQETDKIFNTNAVNDLITKESKTRRQSKGKIDEITNSGDADTQITNKSTSIRQSRIARKDIELEIDLNKSRSSTIVDANIVTLPDFKNNETTTGKQSKNARKDGNQVVDEEDLNDSKITDQLTNSDKVQDLETNQMTTRRRSRNARISMKLEVDVETLNSVEKANDKTSNDKISSDVTRRRSCQNSDSSVAKKLKTDTPPSQLRKKRSKTFEVATLKRNDLQLALAPGEYLKVNETVRKYETKTERERKASEKATSDLALTPSSSLKSPADVTNNTNISTAADNSMENTEVASPKSDLPNKKDSKMAIKRKRSTITSIEPESSNVASTSSSADDTSTNITSKLKLSIEPSTSDVAVTDETQCGVCDVQIEGSWIDHIAYKHSYLAWKKGDPVLDLNNSTAVIAHLKSVLSQTKTLKCSRCRKYKWKNPQSFLNHLKNCDKSDDEDVALSTIQNKKTKKYNDSDEEMALSNLKSKKLKTSEDVEDDIVLPNNKAKKNKNSDDKIALSKLQSKKAKKSKIIGDSKTCGMCSEAVGVNEWDSHVMFKHYNLAWAVGDTPNDLKDTNLLCRLLKAYRNAAGGKFLCNLCGLSRASALGFFAHVVTCGKTDEEIEEHMETCEQCHKRYLAVNRQPHMIFHTQQQIKKEAKERAATVKVEVEVVEPEEETEGGGQKRKAARKAISIIQKLKFDKDEGVNCSRCDFTASTREQLKSHKCVDGGTFQDEDGSKGDESEDSLEFASDHSENEDDDDDEDTAVEDVVVSDEDTDNRRHRKKPKSEHVAKYERIPFEVASEAAYVDEASKLFIKHFFSDALLYEKWRNTEYTVLNEQEIEMYTPQVATSCKFAAGHKWGTLNRFESIKQPTITLFAGGCPAAMSWVPGRLSTSPTERHYLALATHLGPDPPRYSSHKHYTAPGTVLQIWDFGHTPYANSPKLSMCIAMDRGTIWSMSWCPSGARDPASSDSASSEEARCLGLVSVACSDGTAYVYSVPHPNLVVNDGKNPVFIKLKPVAELRLYYDPKKEICQPSKIFWSMQKGHEVVGVGYSNGVVAFYELCAESPLTRRREGERDVFYPYYNKQVHWSGITGISMYPCVSGLGMWSCGAGSGGAVCGSGTSARLGTATAADTPFLPLWPAALLLNDDSLTSEMDLTGVVRKLTSATAVAGCLHCSKLAQFSSPLLKTMYTHPVYKDMKKRPLLFIQMRRLKEPENQTQNRRKPIEPSTYEKAIEEYGVRLKFCDKGERLTHAKEFHPGRFPLSEVSAMAFCPTPSYHHWLAVATHSGLVFFVNTS